MQTRLQAQGAGVTYQQACEMEGLKSFQVATFLLDMIILSILRCTLSEKLVVSYTRLKRSLDCRVVLTA